MSDAIKLLAPCLSKQPLYEEGWSSSKAHGYISIAIALLTMAGAASTYILSGSTVPYLRISISAPLTALISYLFLRYAFGKVDSLSLYFNSIYDTQFDLALPYTTRLSKEEKTALEVDNENRELRFPSNPFLSVRIRNDDIFESRSEAIVTVENSADEQKIQKRGGRAYRKELWELHQSRETSENAEGAASMIGCGELGKLGAHVVIVVTGPQKGTTTDLEKTLFKCYYNSLILANRRNIKSIAFPALGMKVFNADKKRAAAIFLRAICQFVQDSRESHSSIETISIHHPMQEKDHVNSYKEVLQTV